MNNSVLCIWIIISISILYADEKWHAYGKDGRGVRYSSLEQINTKNVSQLKIAWKYRTGDLKNTASFKKKAAFECTPIVVANTMYIATPTCKVIALQADSGKLLWSYDPKVNPRISYSEYTNRGVSTWQDPQKEVSQFGYRRIYLGTLDARLICLDAQTGELCKDFALNGIVDLKDGINLSNKNSRNYQLTSPPAIIGNSIIVGSAIADNHKVKTERGVVRSYHAKTGKLQWSWDPIPRSKSALFADTWRGKQALSTGGANVWSIISVDHKRDLIFLPTSSASPDFYGGERLGDNVYANCVVAIKASTGKVKWHFQVVHHDLWDYDVPCQPMLTTIEKNQKKIDVVIQGTKMGHIFVLDRDTGEPIFPVEELAVAKSDIKGEITSPLQPFPTIPPPLLKNLTEKQKLWGVNEQDRKYAKQSFNTFRYEGIFTPPSLEGTIVYPSTVGGMNWGGATYDKHKDLLVVPLNSIAHIIKLIPRNNYQEHNENKFFRAEVSPQHGTPYGMERQIFFLPSGLPATAPPWGTLAAVQLTTGKIKWRIPLGWMVDPKKVPDSPKWGSVILGGPISTAGGLIFIAGTYDYHLRAIASDTGQELWRTQLPAGGQATPMTYQVNKKQYVAICAGGHGKMQTKQGDYVMVYALDDK
ncbi:pyrroloquinoline quinone-dependent dehydrogenase [Candidatus Uabimicrobium sp. HlEnr_7]|uniref:pyrroloquinoline quinone-dependent dehydrogenase n=1 Tax=Candidatus Uabimicrobium helgolandensis TaxID=3095367 RepID=UPI003557855D